MARRDPRLGRGWRAMAEARSKAHRCCGGAGTIPATPSSWWGEQGQSLLDLGFGRLGMPMGAWAGTADGTSLEESAWKSLP